MPRTPLSRRHFLAASGLATLATGLASVSGEETDGRPPVTNPRATSGDDRFEPKWDERLTVTVGPKDADIVGTSAKALQAAVDYVTRFGGGTVQILPGTYKLRNAVTLSSNVRILGSGLDSILLKEPSHGTKLDVDSDWYDQEITLRDAKGFEVGDGVCLRTKNPHNGGMEVLKRTLIARSGNRFKLDKALRQNYWLMGDSSCTSLFPILTGENIANVVIENVTLDGNGKQNENLDGNYAGCVFLQDCNRIAMRKVTARNYNGDGLSWQICHDVTVEDCHSHDNAGLGMHPGSGSQRPLIRNNLIERNDIGIFFCWGVKYGLAEKNRVVDIRKHGISIGHRDTDNVVRDNDVTGSGQVGVLFRPERGKAFAPHRNLFENNRIINTGDDKAIAVDVQGQVEAVTLKNNVIKETRAPMQRVGVKIGSETKDITLADNRIEGFATEVSDMRTR
ncbi:MAG: right-handed parallel beta-helix repeat-containing protein [Planctomycetaceae bacterium]|nr:right-handed parallel beta-helix repeat-containing protein [Planctomycetaceae bacterium]